MSSADRARTVLTLDGLRTGGKRAMAAALAAIETAAGSIELADLLDRACRDPRAATLGLTGPPGVGKSTLSNALVSGWRRAGETVGVIAIDPSSRRTGGALLGDRARISTDPTDRGVFIRSMAARDRLGGLSDQTVAAMVLMRAVYDRVLIESVGIGQSEADVAMVADTVVLCIQPGSGDSLQFMKAGVMELPDVIVVTKADMGEAALRAKADVEGALTLVTRDSGAWVAPVVLVSSTTGSGLDALADAVAAHAGWLAGTRLTERRVLQERQWVEETIRTRFGTAGLALLPGLDARDGPFQRERAATESLARRLAGSGH
ncbi:methylmalonyl Co-A mutase-associated GTPase MeaB [Phreatobacter aquaticus]|uniref:Methylmalonyl Co-A mutase-associated GTPase MeaB n=1 Tax=Phreatobacter aquaticus TaxID=2570229 RepID=A0A4D7QBB2_9HYPH|nr:methylmalonyl Co-A mutase-associated GTPase MeaB [Phreatobacter aquaticus]QCK85340.1 methylmalonyl Co-A mutase-associated GTPase MeaB [Phreatobacter aquaticus]